MWGSQDWGGKPPLVVKNLEVNGDIKYKGEVLDLKGLPIQLAGVMEMLGDIKNQNEVEIQQGELKTISDVISVEFAHPFRKVPFISLVAIAEENYQPYVILTRSTHGFTAKYHSCRPTLVAWQATA